MFLHDAFGLPFLSDILKNSHLAYMAIVSLAQSVGMYWLNYGAYRLVLFLKNKKAEKVEKV